MLVDQHCVWVSASSLDAHSYTSLGTSHDFSKAKKDWTLGAVLIISFTWSEAPHKTSMANCANHIANRANTIASIIVDSVDIERNQTQPIWLAWPTALTFETACVRIVLGMKLSDAE